MKPVNIVLGRFQPYTKGHQACVDAAFDETSLKTVLCIIETPDNKVDEYHPFPTSIIIPWIEKMIHGGNHIQDYVLVKNADIAKIAEALHGKGYELASWACGTDRYPAYSRQCKGYWEKVGLPEEPKCIEVKRGDDDVSATKAREALKNQDRRAFEKLVPDAFKRFFNIGVEYMRQLNESLKPLSLYLLEAIQNLREFTLEDMMEWGVWVPNDEVTRDDMENIISAIQKQWPVEKDDNYPISTINDLPIICQFTYNKRDLKFIVFQYSAPDKEVVKAVQEITEVMTQTVYSVMGGEEEIKHMLKHLK